MISAWFSASAAPAASPKATATAYFICFPPRYSRAARRGKQGVPLPLPGCAISHPRQLTKNFLVEGLDSGLRPAEDQGVDIVGALVGVDHLEVDEVADHPELVRDAVAAQHVARGARD